MCSLFTWAHDKIVSLIYCRVYKNRKEKTLFLQKRELGIEKKMFRRHKEIQMNRIDRNAVWRERDGTGDKCAKMQQCKRAPPEQSHIYYCCFYASDLKKRHSSFSLYLYSYINWNLHLNVSIQKQNGTQALNVAFST